MTGRALDESIRGRKLRTRNNQRHRRRQRWTEHFHRHRIEEYQDIQEIDREAVC